MERDEWWGRLLASLVRRVDCGAQGDARSLLRNIVSCVLVLVFSLGSDVTNGERAMKTGQLVVCVLAALGASSQWDPADARERKRGSSSEARVEQAYGNLPPGAKTIDAGGKGLKRLPEGGTGPAATKTGPTAPVTCNQQNASSPACYSATQQARPVAR